jgi:hypothetical protein
LMNPMPTSCAIARLRRTAASRATPMFMAPSLRSPCAASSSAKVLLFVPCREVNRLSREERLSVYEGHDQVSDYAAEKCSALARAFPSPDTTAEAFPARRFAACSVAIISATTATD